MAKIKITNNLQFAPTASSGITLPKAGTIQDSSGIQDILQVTREALYKKNEAINNDYLSNSSVKANQDILQLQEGIKTSMSSPVGYADKVQSELDKVYNSYLDQAPSDSARDSLNKYFNDQRTSIYANNFAEENKMIADHVLSNASENINSITNNIAMNPSDLASNVEKLTPIFESVGTVLDPANKEKFQNEAKRQIGNSFIQGLIEKSDYKNAELAINSSEAQKIFNPGEREVYKKALAHKKKEDLEYVKLVREQQINSINDKFFSDFQSGKLNVASIMKSSLPATGEKSKDFWIKKLSSEDAAGNPNLYNKTYADISNFNEEQLFSLADPEKQLQPLNPKQLESLLKAKRNETDEVLKKYFSGIESSLTGTSLFNPVKDPEGDMNFMKLKFEAEQMVANTKIKGTPEYGLTTKTMFDPGSPRFKEFGEALFNKYNKSDTERLNSLAKEQVKNQATVAPKEDINTVIMQELSKNLPKKDNSKE